MGVFILSGITWVFGFVHFNDETQVFAYLFTICQAFLGVWVFAIYILLNQEFQRWFKRSVLGRDSTASRKTGKGGERETSSTANANSTSASTSKTASSNASNGNGQRRRRKRGPRQHAVNPNASSAGHTTTSTSVSMSVSGRQDNDDYDDTMEMTQIDDPEVGVVESDDETYINSSDEEKL